MANIIAEIAPFLADNKSISYVYNRDMKAPQYTDSIPTACVGFDKEGNNTLFLMNKEFMDKLSYLEKCFVFAHEGLHVLFNHGKAGADFIASLPANQGKRSHKLLNYAMDLCINQILIDQYFTDSHYAMPVLKTLVTFDNFEEKEGLVLQRGENFQYYYWKLYNHIKDKSPSDDGTDFGFDNEYETFSDVIDNEETSDAEKKHKEDIHKKGGSQTEKDFSKNSKSKSSGSDKPTGKEVVTQYKNMSIKDAIDRYVMHRNMSSEDKSKRPDVKYTWYGTNRRTVAVKMEKTTVAVRNTKYQNKKHKVLVYCDVSGSVAAYTEKFINLVNMIDTEKCDIVFKVWADSVSSVYYNKDNTAKWSNCGGGTNIKEVIADYNQNYIESKIDCVVVLTDGEYDAINDKKALVKNATKWVFFMVPGSDRSTNNVFKSSTSVTLNW